MKIPSLSKFKTINVTKTTIQAKSRVLSQKYIVEEVQDVEYNLISDEVTNILAEELRKELDWEILTKVCDGTTTFSFRYGSHKNLDEIEQWVRDNTSGRITKAELGIFINFDGNKSAAALFKTFWL